MKLKVSDFRLFDLPRDFRDTIYEYSIDVRIVFLYGSVRPRQVDTRPRYSSESDLPGPDAQPGVYRIIMIGPILIIPEILSRKIPMGPNSLVPAIST